MVVDVVVRSPLPINLAAVEAILTITVALLLTAHVLPSVVYQIGICVLGVGPHVCSPSASVAPALAPSSIEYSSTTRSSQSPLLAGTAVTLVKNCATSAQTAASRPVLKSREISPILSLDGFKSTPAFTPTRRMAESTMPEFWIVTGRNSNLPPLLERRCG